jgi:hypothetical protein
VRLYIDDDSAGDLLLKLLRAAGHDVQIPADVGHAGDPDPVHSLHAIRQGRVLVTMNHDDFKQLHGLVLGSGGHHPGLLVIRKDNDAARDMSPRGIVNAIARFGASGGDPKDQFVILNKWR